MMAACKLPDHKYFIPNKGVAPLTYKQTKNIGEFIKKNPERGAKFVGALAKSLDDKALTLLKAGETYAPSRMQSKTRIGTPLSKIDEENAKAAEELIQANSNLGEDTLDNTFKVADRIARNYRKGDILQGGERQIVYNVYAQQLDRLPLVMNQLDAAIESNSGELMALAAADLTKFISASTAISGDKNAVQIAFKSFERLNKILTSGKGGQINQLFIDGTC
jgi:hypothetical protein